MNRATVNKIFQKHPVYVKAGMIASFRLLFSDVYIVKIMGKSLKKMRKEGKY